MTLATTVACSDETGILVSTTANAEITETIFELQYFVAIDIGDDTPLIDDQQREGREPVGERDLRKDAFRMMIRPQRDAPSDAFYTIGVIAFNEAGDQLGFGYLPAPVGFVSGSVTQWDIEIRGFTSDDDSFPDNCIRWADGDTQVTIGNLEDRDCDGYKAADPISPDCDDSNAAINPGATEQCDNGFDDDCDGLMDGFQADGVTRVTEEADGVDNNCDGRCDNDPELDEDRDGFTSFGRFGVCSESIGPNDCERLNPYRFPGAWDFCDSEDSDCDGLPSTSTPCFMRKNDLGSSCLQGVRTCPSPADPVTVCILSPVPSDTLSIPFACEAYANCRMTSNVGEDPFECMLDKLEESLDGAAINGFRTECSTFHSGFGTCPGGSMDIELPGDDTDANDECSYQLIGPSQQQGYIVSLAPTAGGPSGTIVNECKVTLTVDTTDAGGAAVVLISVVRSGHEPGLLRITLSNDLASDCDQPELDCDAWGVAQIPPLPGN